MSTKNRRLLIVFSLVLICGYAIVGTVVHEYAHRYAIEQNKRKLDQLLLNQRALRLYVEEELKPIVYRLKTEGKLYEEYFDPKMLSSTYIARNVHDYLNHLRDERGTSRIHYKLATDNPRNPANRATPEELRILEYFRARPEARQVWRLIRENGHSYIYYAMPIEPNRASCMQCHSTPDIAPAELVERYGKRSGFGEREGNIRAIISLKMPFDRELVEADRMFLLVMGVLALFLTTLFGVVFYFVRKLDRSQQLIEEKNRCLSILAERDPLTDVYNRRSFDADLEHYCTQENLVLIMFDIDHFKQINDTYGHQKGDDVLRELSALIRANLREEDHFYRIGGEEFAVLTYEEDVDVARALAQRLLRAIARHDFSLPHPVHISAGIASKAPSETPRNLYKRADEALYRAKAEGRNRIVVD